MKMDSSLNYGKSKPTSSPTTPIHFAREKPGPSNPTGNTSVSSATELTASPMAGFFYEDNGKPTKIYFKAFALREA